MYFPWFGFVGRHWRQRNHKPHGQLFLLCAIVAIYHDLVLFLLKTCREGGTVGFRRCFFPLGRDDVENTPESENRNVRLGMSSRLALLA